MIPAERVRELAAEANSYLWRDAGRDILLPADDAPQWFADLCREAHGGMLPDDWRYEFVRDALSAILQLPRSRGVRDGMRMLSGSPADYFSELRYQWSGAPAKNAAEQASSEVVGN